MGHACTGKESGVKVKDNNNNEYRRMYNTINAAVVVYTHPFYVVVSFFPLHKIERKRQVSHSSCALPTTA